MRRTFGETERVGGFKIKIKTVTLFCVLLSFSQSGWCQDLQFDVLLEPKLPEKSSVYIIAKLKNNTADTFRVAHFTHLSPAIEMELTDLETGTIYNLINSESPYSMDRYPIKNSGVPIAPGKLYMKVMNLNGILYNGYLPAGKYRLKVTYYPAAVDGFFHIGPVVTALKEFEITNVQKDKQFQLAKSVILGKLSRNTLNRNILSLPCQDLDLYKGILLLILQSKTLCLIKVI